METKKATDTAGKKDKRSRVRSPEELDAYIRVVRPGTALLIGAFTLIVVALVVWGVTGSLPVTVGAKGVLGTDYARMAARAEAEDMMDNLLESTANLTDEELEVLGKQYVYCFLDAYQYNRADLEGKKASVAYPGKQPVQGKIAWVESLPVTKETITKEFRTSFIADTCATSDYSWVVAVETDEAFDSEIYSLMDVTIEIGQVKPISMLFQ